MARDSRPSYLIFGTGALGSVIGGLLQIEGSDVTFVGRGRYFDGILRKGLRITGIWGDRFIPPERIKGSTDPSHIGEKFPVVLLCVKSTDTGSAAALAAPLLDDDGIMVSIQNGLGNWEAIAACVGEERTVGARVIFGAETLEPGLVNVSVYADKVLLGEPFVPVNRQLLKSLEGDLNRAGIPTAAVSREEIHSAIWGKVLYNTALNPLGAILEVPYGRLGGSPEAREVMREIIGEVFAVMAEKGISLPYKTPDDYYRFFIESQLPSTAEHHASMLQDIMMGRATEIDALNGAISMYGKKVGVPTPYNDLLTALIKFKEKPGNRLLGRTFIK